MKIVLGIVLVLFISFWLTFIISVGVNAGMKTFYKDNFQKKGGKRK